MKGIEPSYAAWEAAVLPLNYTRVRQSDYGIPVAKAITRRRSATSTPIVESCRSATIDAASIFLVLMSPPFCNGPRDLSGRIAARLNKCAKEASDRP